MKSFTNVLFLTVALMGSSAVKAQSLEFEENLADASSVWATTLNSTTAYSGTIVSNERTWNCTNLFYSTSQTGLNMKTSSPESILEFPVISKKVHSVVLSVKFGSKPSGTPVQLVLQRKSTADGEWTDVGQTAITGNSYNDFTIPITNPTTPSYLRLHYVSPTYGLFIKSIKIYTVDESMKAPVVGEPTMITSDGAVLNWSADPFAEGYEVEVSKLNVLTNQQLISNGGFEDADLTMWNTDYLSTENAFEGTHSFKSDASTMTSGAKTFRYQPNPSILPYSKVTISSKYYVSSLAETHGEVRSWSEFLALDGTTIASTNAHISGEPDFQTVSTQWNEMSGTFTAPYNAAALQVDFRSQFGVLAYFDNISVVSDVRAAGETPIANSPFTGIHQVSHSLSNLEPDSYYSAYVYSVQGTSKLKSAEMIFKTALSTGISTDKSVSVGVITTADGIQITNTEAGETISVYLLSGQMIKTIHSVGGMLYLPLSKGVYVVKVASSTYKVIL